MGTGRHLVIGIDFDNTLVVYDELFRRMAEERGLISAADGRSKKEVRDLVRLLPEGEIQWQRLQAAAYGPRIAEAPLAEGAAEFLRRGRQANAKIYVISHKTERAGYDETNTNLRQAATEWMRDKGLFQTGGDGLTADAVRFGATRQEKIDFIRSLGCTHFIDDLEETYQEASFPAGVEKILYAPHPPETVPPGVRVAVSWKDIGEHLFGS
jgi:hypothetical protein